MDSLVILVSFILVFLWKKSEFAVYTVPLLGILVSIYLLFSLRRKLGSKKRSFSQDRRDKNQLLSVFLLNTSALLIILSTGGLHSALFFLLYFINFYLALMLVPETAFVFTIAVIILFFPEVVEGNLFANGIKIFSLVFLCPLAYFFGKGLQVSERKEIVIEQSASKIEKDVSELVKSQGKDFKEENIDKLHDIVEQAKKLEQ